MNSVWIHNSSSTSMYVTVGGSAHGASTEVSLLEPRCSQEFFFCGPSAVVRYGPQTLAHREARVPTVYLEDVRKTIKAKPGQKLTLGADPKFEVIAAVGLLGLGLVSRAVGV